MGAEGAAVQAGGRKASEGGIVVSAEEPLVIAGAVDSDVTLHLR